MIVSMPAWPRGLSWYTSDRKPTLKIESGSAAGLAATVPLGFGAVEDFGCLGAFSFLALGAFVLSGRFPVSMVAQIAQYYQLSGGIGFTGES